jgi:hypothetical protein
LPLSLVFGDLFVGAPGFIFVLFARVVIPVRLPRIPVVSPKMDEFRVFICFPSAPSTHANGAGSINFPIAIARFVDLPDSIEPGISVDRRDEWRQAWQISETQQLRPRSSSSPG